MRTVIASLLTAAALFAQQPAEPPKPGRVEGVVVGTEGEPIGRAQLRLTSGLSFLNGTIAPGANYQSAADDAGKFVFENIPPGRNYSLQVEKPGYVTARYGARSANALGVALVIEEGQTLTNVKLTMQQQGTISGTAVDRNGDPVQGVRVMTQRRGYQNGVRTLLPAGTATTDDRGIFRVSNVAPGRYYVLASPNRVTTMGIEEADLTTYFPNAADSRGASPLEVSGGQEVRNVEIRLRQGRVYSASGTVVDDTGAPLPNAVVLSAMQGADLASELGTIIAQAGQGRTGPNGEFTLRGLPAGSYDAAAVDIVAVAGGNIKMGVGSFTISNRDVDGVTVRMGGGATITGTARVEGAELSDILPKAPEGANGVAQTLLAQIAAASPEAAALLGNAPPSVGLTGAVGNLRGVPAGQLKPDGTFRIESVPPGNYQVSFGSLPPDVYPKTVMYGGSDALSSGVTIGVGGGGTLDIVLAQNAAKVDGKVLDASGEPEVGMTVSLWTEEARPGAANGGVHSATTGRDGVAHFVSLPPGVYRIAAFENVDPSLAVVRDFVAQLSTDAVRVTVAEGALAVETLKPIPVAKIRAAEDNLP